MQHSKAVCRNIQSVTISEKQEILVTSLKIDKAFVCIVQNYIRVIDDDKFVPTLLQRSVKFITFIIIQSDIPVSIQLLYILQHLIQIGFAGCTVTAHQCDPAGEIQLIPEGICLEFNFLVNHPVLSFHIPCSTKAHNRACQQPFLYHLS